MSRIESMTFKISIRSFPDRQSALKGQQQTGKFTSWNQARQEGAEGVIVRGLGHT